MDIEDEIMKALLQNGTGIAVRSVEDLTQKILKGKAIIAKYGGESV